MMSWPLCTQQVSRLPVCSLCAGVVNKRCGVRIRLPQLAESSGAIILTVMWASAFSSSLIIFMKKT